MDSGRSQNISSGSAGAPQDQPQTRTQIQNQSRRSSRSRSSSNAAATAATAAANTHHNQNQQTPYPPSYPSLSRDSTSASTTTITPRTDSWPSKFASQPSNNTSAPSSGAPSPLASREQSPVRTHSRTNTRASFTTPAGSGSVAAGSRSRKNSLQDISPSRSVKPSHPSLPTSSSRTLSSGTTPALLPAASSSSDRTINAPAPIKSPTALEHLKESPRWPVSPRLRSPPPILNKPSLGPPRRPEQETPSICVQRATPPHPANSDVQSDSDLDDAQLQSGTRTPARGAGGSTSTLETVQEVSPLGSPKALEDSLEEKLHQSFTSEAPSQSDAGEFSLSQETAGKGSAAMTNESGSESGSIKGGRRTGSSSVPPLTTRQSSASIKPGGAKGKAGEISLQNMTVETETVTSIPQVALAPGVGTQGTNGSLRTKPSSETIRPKKEKKKPTRKQPTVTTGTASSKADIFEAKVASAVEEANSSDSEETFVYDSNPPDRDRPHRFHSRTPSATSMVSQVDRNGMRSIHAVMEGAVAGPPVTVKRSMKFVNTYNSSANEGSIAEDDGKGTARSNAGSARGTTRHHHHIGRWGRNGGGNGHPSLFAEHSPFNASLSAGNNSSRQSSGPPSPRFAGRGPSINSKRGTHLSAGYDLDDNTGADDETTPLIQSSTIRSSRSGRRRGMHSLRSMESQSYRPQPGVLNRFATCLVVVLMLVLVVSGALGFMFATSQPLTDIELVSMDHVVASEQELMLDITIKAHNPNIIVVMVDSADIEVFAKSPNAGTDSEWWRHLHPGEDGDMPLETKTNRSDNVSTMDDPIDDQPPPEDSSPNMRLGTITAFDNPLTFEGSFFHSGISYSTGAVRLMSPGNGTIGGPERWERIIKDEFQLVLKGVLKYTLPLSQTVRKATVSGKMTVKPNAANDPPTPHPNSTTSRGDFSISI